MKSLSKSKIVSMLGSIALVMVAGCSDSNVEGIKTGTFNGRDDVTIGAIIEERFDDCKWTSGKETGRTVVIFKGKISKATHDLAMKRFKSEWTLQDWFSQVENYPMEMPKGLSELRKKKIKQYDYETIEKKIGTTPSHLPEFNKILEKRTKTKCKIMWECFDELYWPTGSEVELKWIIFPDGETFELDSITNTSWRNFNMNWQQVMQILFSK